MTSVVDRSEADRLEEERIARALSRKSSSGAIGLAKKHTPAPIVAAPRAEPLSRATVASTPAAAAPIQDMTPMAGAKAPKYTAEERKAVMEAQRAKLLAAAEEKDRAAKEAAGETYTPPAAQQQQQQTQTQSAVKHAPVQTNSPYKRPSSKTNEFVVSTTPAAGSEHFKRPSGKSGFSGASGGEVSTTPNVAVGKFETPEDLARAEEQRLARALLPQSQRATVSVGTSQPQQASWREQQAARDAEEAERKRKLAQQRASVMGTSGDAEAARRRAEEAEARREAERQQAYSIDQPLSEHRKRLADPYLALTEFLQDEPKISSGATSATGPGTAQTARGSVFDRYDTDAAPSKSAPRSHSARGGSATDMSAFPKLAAAARSGTPPVAIYTEVEEPAYVPPKPTHTAPVARAVPAPVAAEPVKPAEPAKSPSPRPPLDADFRDLDALLRAVDSNKSPAPRAAPLSRSTVAGSSSSANHIADLDALLNGYSSPPTVSPSSSSSSFAPVSPRSGSSSSDAALRQRRQEEARALEQRKRQEEDRMRAELAEQRRAAAAAVSPVLDAADRAATLLADSARLLATHLIGVEYRDIAQLERLQSTIAGATLSAQRGTGSVDAAAIDLLATGVSAVVSVARYAASIAVGSVAQDALLSTTRNLLGMAQNWISSARRVAASSSTSTTPRTPDDAAVRQLADQSRTINELLTALVRQATAAQSSAMVRVPSASPRGHGDASPSPRGAGVALSRSTVSASGSSSSLMPSSVAVLPDAAKQHVAAVVATGRALLAGVNECNMSDPEANPAEAQRIVTDLKALQAATAGVKPHVSDASGNSMDADLKQLATATVAFVKAWKARGTLAALEELKKTIKIEMLKLLRGLNSLEPRSTPSSSPRSPSPRANNTGAAPLSPRSASPAPLSPRGASSSSGARMRQVEIVQSAALRVNSIINASPLDGDALVAEMRTITGAVRELMAVTPSPVVQEKLQASARAVLVASVDYKNAPHSAPARQRVASLLTELLTLLCAQLA